ncbi:MAG TPA: hypothetical protein DCE71_00210, partial [Parachlamydiales bacterium]|nr:hypothetical protein [Parachlamydiales bacterium]
ATMILASFLRHLQFYAHIGHNVLGGKEFLPNHAFLGELYAGYEDDYDAVVERMIGTGVKVDLVKIHEDALKNLEEPSTYEDCFEYILKKEEELCKNLVKISEESSIGTQNLLSDIADRSEMRQYKLKQILK